MTTTTELRARRDRMLAMIEAEREAQDKKWGEQNHAPAVWLLILSEEVGEFCKACLERDPIELRKELVQVAAVALAMTECGDRNEWWPR